MNVKTLFCLQDSKTYKETHCPGDEKSSLPHYQPQNNIKGYK